MATSGRVLIVDDQPQSLEAMQEALRPLGFEVLTAPDGEAGLALARERQPDVILLDIMMPGMDGFEVCQRLKDDPETRLLPVVFLTGLDSREARFRGLEVGASDFLNKPFDLVELEVRVRNLVGFRRLTQDLEDAEKMLFAVARSVEARDEGTGDHCDRLSRLAERLGEYMGLGPDGLKALRRAGYLHDIGKIGIPDAILLKPGKLTEEEWTVMRSHVNIGVEICSGLRTLRSTLPIIRHHHERSNGSGYPDHLVGDAVPLLARVFQVTDVFDALTNERPYRRALSVAEACKILRDETERGFWDGNVVEALVAMVGWGVEGAGAGGDGAAQRPGQPEGGPSEAAKPGGGGRDEGASRRAPGGGDALRRVLVADDSPVFRTFVCDTLRGRGLEVLEAGNGREAVEVLLGQRPQLAILDALMPAVDGFEVMERLKTAAPDYRPVIFVVTAVYKSPRWAAEARNAYKVAEYLEKPLEPEDLVKTIGRHLPGFLGPA